MRRSPRKTVNLSESVHQQLNSYALAAGAAGVSLLALAQPSEAKIVYRPTLVNISPNTSYKVDFGLGPVPILTIGNFRLFSKVTTSYNRCFDGLSVKGDVAGSSASTKGHTIRLAYALSSGATIGPQQKFQQASSVIMANVYYNHSVSRDERGAWLNATNRYLGLRFQVNGQFHYGWARLNVRSSVGSFVAYCQIFATLTGYAYETVPNTPIIAGKTHSADAKQPTPASLKTNTPEAATLGVLAIGAPGLSIWRRDEPRVLCNR
jgi:hypothetical protein